MQEAGQKAASASEVACQLAEAPQGPISRRAPPLVLWGRGLQPEGVEAHAGPVRLQVPPWEVVCWADEAGGEVAGVEQ